MGEYLRHLLENLTRLCWGVVSHYLWNSRAFAYNVLAPSHIVLHIVGAQRKSGGPRANEIPPPLRFSNLCCRVP